jgi:hypothetical protein
LICIDLHHGASIGCRHDAPMPDYPDDLAECAHAMVKRHGAGARSVAKIFADAQAMAGNEEMAAFWKAVTEAIQNVGAGALALPLTLRELG